MSIRYFFKQRDKKSCGVCVINTILKIYYLPGAIFSVGDNGTSPKRILHELRKAGLIAVSKKISIRNLKPRSILYYSPPKDHYVVVGEIANGWVLIYDSGKKEPYWLRLSTLRKKWGGWVIETKRE